MLLGRMILKILLNVISFGYVFGDGYVGINGFAMLNSKFPCDEYVGLVNEGGRPGISLLYGTFSDKGSNWGCVKKFVESNKDREHLVQVHFSNESCRDDGKCVGSDFYPKYTVKKLNSVYLRMPKWMSGSIKKNLGDIDKKLVGIVNEKTKVLISTGLEDNFTLAVYRKLRKEFKKYTKFEIMRSPVDEKVNSSFIVEYHGLSSLCTKGNHIGSNDGIEITGKKESIKEFAKNKCYALFYWDGALQGRDVKFKPPLERDFKFTVALQDSYRLFLDYLQE